jgi:hypothetical protein
LVLVSVEGDFANHARQASAKRTRRSPPVKVEGDENTEERCPSNGIRGELDGEDG